MGKVRNWNDLIYGMCMLAAEAFIFGGFICRRNFLGDYVWTFPLLVITGVLALVFFNEAYEK